MRYPRRCLYEVPGVIRFIDSKMLVAKGSGKGEGELFGECRALVLQNEKTSGDWLQDNVNVLNSTELIHFTVLFIWGFFLAMLCILQDLSSVIRD